MDIAASEKKLVSMSYPGRQHRRPNPILLRVQKQKEDDVCYLLDRSMPLRALMADYCARKGFPCEAVRFTYDGGRLPEAKSADDLGLEDEDVIDAWDDKIGG